MKYRPEIDGLRTLAVMPVILFHAGLNLFSGGYVGVDVFFVISGYLITTILLNELNSGSFSIIKFYERRFRRIIPPVAAMALVVSILCWHYMMPKELQGFGRSLAAMSTFWANIYFYKTTGYFDLEAESKPLLHTWSLSVEEQFYIIFPFILMLIFRFHKKIPLAYISALALISFAASSMMVNYSQPDAFYLLHFRAWELLAGAALASLHCSKNERWAKVRTSRFTPMLGFTLILAPMLLYTNKIVFPGLAALPVILGTMVLIDAYKDGVKDPLGRLLTLPPVVGVGKISYALYLWHWPFLTLPPIVLNKALSPLQITAALAMTFAASILSWYAVEQPIRTKRILPTRKGLMSFSFAAIAILVTIGITAGLNDNLYNRIHPQASAYLKTAENDLKSTMECLREVDSVRLPPCVVGDRSLEPSFIMWGDSHAEAWRPALNDLAQEYGVSGLVHTMASCPPLFGYISNEWDTKNNSGCRKFNEEIFELIDKYNISDICLDGNFTRYVEGLYGKPPSISRAGEILSAEESRLLFQEKLGETIAILKERNIRIWVVQSVPVHSVDVSAHLAQRLNLNMKVDENSIILSKEAYLRQYGGAKQAIDFHGSSLTFLPLTPPLCDERRCVVLGPDGLYYRDRDHLSSLGARLLKDTLREMFRTMTSGPASDLEP